MPTVRTSSTRRRPVLTGRALVLGAVVVLLVVVLASPIQRYLQSRSDLAGSAQQLRDDRAELARLKKEKARYGDPGYIEQQARKRLQYAMPGDTVYVVVNQGSRTGIEKSADAARAEGSKPAWNTRLMDSVRAAAQ